MVKVERIKSGIEGFDELIEGGIPKNSLILLTGSCGTGKTTFGMQFLYQGATLYNEPGIYITLEEDPERLIKNMQLYGWDIYKAMAEKKLLVIKAELYKFDALKSMIESNITRMGAKRVVIDTITSLGLFFKRPVELRRSIIEFGQLLKKLDCTVMMITEVPEGRPGISSFGVEEFICDGVVVLYYVRQKNVFYRAINVRKMRATNHSTKIHPVKITSEGITVYPKQELFA
jgi:KaiC/GvpD/RAD55 family RecA-like ATPase